MAISFTEKRKAEAERIRQKYPDRIPVCTTYVGAGVDSTRLLDALLIAACRGSTGHLREGR